MKRLCFATNNLHKLEEVRAMSGGEFILSLSEIGCQEEIPEDFATLEENSMQKATYVSSRYDVDCFSDDSGLEVEALNGEPGAISAMYAGPERDAKKNMALLLKKLAGVTNRRARFRTVITLVEAGEPIQFSGEVTGIITEHPAGTNGFGYDPVFKPDGFDCTMAELPMEAKNRISHRAAAVEKLVTYLTARRA